MITAGDIQFEPVSPKTLFVTNSIALMASGDSAFHAEVLTDVLRTVVERVEREPENWWTVNDVAALYARVRKEAIRRRAEAAILAPLGMTGESFITLQRSLDPGLVGSLASDLVAFDGPPVSVLIVGVDQNELGVNPHIYTIHNDHFSCEDLIGFSAIGTGSRHAETSLMLSGHSWRAELPEALLNGYFAKKDAETAPGVGTQTDMFLIGPELGSHTRLADSVVQKLHSEFTRAKAREKRAKSKANAEVKRYVDDLLKVPPLKQDALPASERPADPEK
jgi:hypothetical protein